VTVYIHQIISYGHIVWISNGCVELGDHLMVAVLPWVLD